jgi:hypothetical protein
MKIKEILEGQRDIEEMNAPGTGTPQPAKIQKVNPDGSADVVDAKGTVTKVDQKSIAPDTKDPSKLTVNVPKPKLQPGTDVTMTSETSPPLSPDDAKKIEKFKKTSPDGSTYYELPSTDPKEIGAKMGDRFTSPEAMAKIKDPEVQKQIIQHLLLMMGDKTAPVKSSSAPANLSALEEEEMQRLVKLAGLRQETVQDMGNGVKKKTNPDGSYEISDGSGTKIYDAKGQLVKTVSPRFAGVQTSKDSAGQQSTNYQQGPLSVNKNADGTTDAQYDVGNVRLKSGPSGQTAQVR